MLGLRSVRTASPVIRSSLARSSRQAGPRRWASGEAGELKGAADNAFNRERQAVKNHAGATADTWRKLSIFVVIPCLIISSVNAWRLWSEHWEHKAHEPPVEEHTEYPFMNIRNKAFPWGDGDKTAFWTEGINHHKKE